MTLPIKVRLKARSEGITTLADGLSRGVAVRLEWKPQNCWIGVYWKRKDTRTDVWVCLIPMLPVHVWWYRLPWWMRKS